jgi:phage terminase large subunit
MTATERKHSFSDPVQFQEGILRRRLWEAQRRIAIAAATKRATAVKGCHGAGKTFIVSGTVLHHLTNYPRGKVFTVAPTLRQVKLMWEEIELARRGGKIGFPECSSTGLRISEERYGLGFSAGKGVNAQGMHGEDVLIILDETPGIQADVMDAIEGIRMAGRVRMLMLGNPVVPSGPFYDAFTTGRASTECITISAFDTPNLQHEAGRPFTIAELEAMSEEELSDSPFPALTSRFGVLDRYRRWGPGNPRYISRVLGEFPSQSEHAVFDLAWIERARREPSEQEIERAKGSLLQVGIDVAGPGDAETAGCARVNGIIVARAHWADKDPRGAVSRWLSNLRSRFPIAAVVVDVVGIGYNFALHLADQNYPVFGFNAGGAAMDNEHFINAKAEQYFRLRDMMRENYVCHAEGTLDEECEAQLSGLEYKETSRGLIQIEPKEEARKRGLPSPDRAEAKMMAFCRVQPRSVEIDMTDRSGISPV